MNLVLLKRFCVYSKYNSLYNSTNNVMSNDIKSFKLKYQLLYFINFGNKIDVLIDI